MLFSAISIKLDQMLPGLLTGNKITSIITNQPTSLQIALGVSMKNSKELLSHMYDYRVTCSYDEILHFKKSSADATAKDLAQQGLCTATSGLVQAVYGNFDADISSNGKLSTYSLALIMMQSSSNEETPQDDRIRRLKNEELSCPIQVGNTEEFSVYHGQQKPAMPVFLFGTEQGDIQRHQSVSRDGASENDFAFFSCPEYQGCNMRLCSVQGHTLRPNKKTVCPPRLGMPSAHLPQCYLQCGKLNKYHKNLIKSM